jgi:hypothetical protein
MRRLSRTEYNNTVRDLLSDTTRPADAFVPDEQLLGFAAGLSVSSVLVEQYRTAAEQLGANAAADVEGLLGCAPQAAENDPCAEGFIESFARRAYRRPLETEERDGLRLLYGTAAVSYGSQKAVELVIQAVLQSPQFLYRIETGIPSGVDGVVALTAHEMASRLSYFLWQTTPTDELLAAADAGELDTVEGIERLARTMVADDRARDTVKSFHEQWLELEELETTGKDEAIYPGFDDTMRAAMREETLKFVEYAMFEGGGSVETLLTSPVSFVNDTIAPLYGLSSAGADFTRTDLDPTQRAGLLTQPSILSIFSKANQSSPVHRGKFVRERLLCHELQPPPPGLVIVPPDLDPTLPTRERFAQHSENEACAACHQLTDRIGFGFEHYDGIGRHREMDGDFEVDASGELIATRDADGPFYGVIELAERLAASSQVKDCIASNWFIYAFGRSITNTLDVCSRARLFEAFEASGYNVRELLVAMVGTDAFRYRRLPQ